MDPKPWPDQVYESGGGAGPICRQGRWSGKNDREKGEPMICPFCKLDVEKPCHNTQEMQRRANHHIEHCEDALKRLKGVVWG